MDYIRKLDRLRINEENSCAPTLAERPAAETKKARQDTSTSAVTDGPNSHKSEGKSLVAALPSNILRVMGEWGGGGCLGSTSKEARTAIPAHVSIDMIEHMEDFGSVKDPNGTLAESLKRKGPAGRREIKHITIHNARHIQNEEYRGYKALQEIVQYLVKQSRRTLRSLTVKGTSRSDSAKVAAIVGVLAPPPSSTKPRDTLSQTKKKRRAVLKLTSMIVEHSHGSVFNLGFAVMARRVVNLERLDISNCHVNRSQLMPVVNGIGSGYLPNLREMVWDGVAAGGSGVSNIMLKALALKKCPMIEKLSFIDNLIFDQDPLDELRDGLTACPNLRVLRMDATMNPEKQFRDLLEMLCADELPRLESIEMRLPDLSFENNIELKNMEKEMEAVFTAGKSRVPPINVTMWLPPLGS